MRKLVMKTELSIEELLASVSSHVLNTRDSSRLRTFLAQEDPRYEAQIMFHFEVGEKSRVTGAIVEIYDVSEKGEDE